MGLHPYAITVLGALLKSAAKEKQVIVSTQSVDLLSEFSADNVIVVNRENNSTLLTGLNAKDFDEWLQEYNLGELWEKNILGGRPAR